MKRYRFSLIKECMEELPSRKDPETLIVYNEDDREYYTEMLKEYVEYLSSLKSIPVSKEFLKNFEDQKIYNEDEFEIKQEQKMGYGETIKSGGFENGSQIYFESVAVPKQNFKIFELSEELDKIRNRFYDEIPTGAINEVSFFDLIVKISEHFKRLDTFSDKLKQFAKNKV